MAQNEYPMYSPFERAKLYRGFVFKDGEDEQTQLSRFTGNETLKWMPEKKTQYGTYQPIPGLIMTDGILRVKTNSQLEIGSGDYLSLKHPAFKHVRFFCVEGTPEQEGDFFPKYRLKFQHIVLKPAKFDSLNSTRGELKC